MDNISTTSWQEAFFTSPGPRTAKQALLLTLKGLCMGTADIIPGVSGGTIALITGIYGDLLVAVKSAGMGVLKKLLSFDIKSAIAEIHIRFLVCLFLGIATAIISLARIMNHLIHNQPVLTWSLFFGLIAASIFIVGKKVEEKTGHSALMFVMGAASAWYLVGLIPVSTPEGLLFIFLTGLIAICAMILPGISGAYFLLVLGKYEFITAKLKNPFLPDNFLVIVVFCLGCFVGLLLFSRVLSYLLSKWDSLTFAFLTGLMAGAMRKIWPWKEVLEEKIIRGKAHVISEQNIFPGEINTEFFIALGLMVTGFFIVIVLDRVSREKVEEGLGN
jgi:putative membrane protein